MNVGESPSFAATQNKCGRLAHTPIAVYYTRRVQWVKQATKKQRAVASQMQRSVVAIETFPLMLRHLRQTSVGDEPKKKPTAMRSGLCWKCDLKSARVLATASELVLELLDATSGIDETLLTGKGGVRISSNIANYHLVINAIDCFSLATTHGGASQIFSASRNIDEGNRVELWMNISFHSSVLSEVSSYP